MLPRSSVEMVRAAVTHERKDVVGYLCLQWGGKRELYILINYSRPDLKRVSFSAEDERIVMDAHRILGNKWDQIAKHLSGRTHIIHTIKFII
ncbi:unnamed protein product [Musa hybrid cultivar]